MPQDNPVKQATIIDAIAENTAQVLVHEAKERIKQLFENKKHIGAMQSNLDILMQRYFVDKSFFDQAADWYGKKLWWNKTITAVSFVGLNVLVGALFNLTASLLIVAIGFYVVVHKLLTSHYTIATTRSELICADILGMEQELKNQVERLSEIEISLQQVFLRLNQEQLRMSERNVVLEDTVQRLKEQVANLEDGVEQLVQTKSGLEVTNQKLQEQVELLGSGFSAAQAELEKKTSELSALNQQLLALQSQLTNSGDNLDDIHLRYQQQLQKLTELEASVNELLASLTKAVERKASQDLPADPGSSVEDFDDLLASALENIEKSRRARGESDALLAGEGDSVENGRLSLTRV